MLSRALGARPIADSLVIVLVILLTTTYISDQ